MRRPLRILGGFALLVLGGILALPGVPGPGIVLIVMSLFLLSEHFAWARKTMAWIKERAAGWRAKAAAGRDGIQS